MTRPASPLRGPLTSVSALLVVGLLVGTSLRVVQPAVRDFQRDTGTDRAAVRQLTVTLAKAVRDLVGSDTHKPSNQVVQPGITAEAAHGRQPAPSDPPSVYGQHLRTELLDLPPPLVVA